MTTRALRAGTLVLWAAFFDYLLISGEDVKFVGSRTEWVVWFGAIALTAIAAGALWGLRGSGEARPVTRREGLATFGMLTPIVLLLMIPSPQLGAQAAAKKAGARVSLPLPREGKGGPITIYDVAAASGNAEYARRRGLEPGLRVRIDGVVITAGGAGVPLDLTRFRASCCAADAIPFTIRVTTPEDSEGFGQDRWVEVTGRLTERSGTWGVDAEQLVATEPPVDPYAY